MRLPVCTYTPGDWLAYLWDQGRTDDFRMIRKAVRKYREVKIYSDTVRMFVCSPRVNAMPDVTRNFDFDNAYFLPDIAPCYLRISVNDKELGYRVYADGPIFEIGVRNPDGFGVIPRPGWEPEAVGKLFHKTTMEAIKGFLAKNAKVSYA